MNASRAFDPPVARSYRDAVCRVLHERAAALAIVAPDDAGHANPGRATWGDIAALARQLGNLLGVSSDPYVQDQATVAAPVRRVGLITSNALAPACALVALWALGQRVVLLNALLPPERLCTEIDSAQVDWLIASAAQFSALGETLDNQVASDGVVRAEVGLDGFDLQARSIGLPCVDAASSATIRETGEPRTPGIEVFTSGTSGPPKRISHREDTLLNAAQVEEWVVRDTEDQVAADRQGAAFINFYPLANIAGLYFLAHCAYAGRTTVLLPKFAVDSWVRAVKVTRPTILYIPPAAIRMTLDARVPAEDLTGALIMRTGNAPLEDHVRAAFEARYGVPVLSHYGATEFCGVVTTWLMGDVQRYGRTHRHSLGRARPGVTLRVVDAASCAPMSTGELGVLEVRAERVGPEWIRTTDLARIDADGFLFVEGRADGAINRGGFKVLPEQVVAVLLSHPAILDAGVIGVKDLRLGEVPVAALVGRPGIELPSTLELDQFARSHLAAYQVPASFVFVTDLPKTESMKLDRRRLRSMLDAAVSSERIPGLPGADCVTHKTITS